ncbi:mobile element protein [Vibrio ishigakensis]|uniref:Mobile element protein n=1 Tax=Vibrio ishigakensis TaxID=1481914 RepID=A0A0B8NNU5_9VIBR|nr:mobile element protein [Vibrio ishigakensis]
MYLRIRQRLIKQRTQLMNQIRGLLLEYGLCVNRGFSALRRTVPELLEDPNNELTWVARELFNELNQEFIVLNERIEQLETKLKAFAKENHVCQIAKSVVGIGLSLL